MTHFVGLDVSQKMTAICVVDNAGHRLWRGQCPTVPEQITVLVRRHAGDEARIGIETGAMTPWLVHELRNLGLEVVCLDARHARGALKMQINKTDQNDAEGLAQIVSHWLVPVRSRQVVRKPPRACSSGRNDSTHRYDDPIVQPHPGGAQDLRPSARLGCGDCHSIGRSKLCCLTAPTWR
jgi:Transposase